MIKKLLIALLVLLAVTACIPKQWMMAEAAEAPLPVVDVSGSWQTIDQAGVIDFRLGCSFSPCSPNSGSVWLDGTGEIATYEVRDGRLYIGGVLFGIVSSDGSEIVDRDGRVYLRK